MRSSSAHRQRARLALAGNWGIAIVVALLIGILGVNGSGYPYLQIQTQIHGDLPINNPHIPILFASLAGIAASAALAQWVIHLILGGVLQLGSARFHVNLIDGKPAEFSDLFSQFSHFGSALIMCLLRSIFILLWMLLLIVPGIIAAYSYEMAPYILMEDPQCGGYEALKRSKELMRGHKMELFVLELSFIGWHLLCILSLGIGFLWLNPYISTAKASFYRDLVQQAAPQSHSAPDPF